MMPQKEKEKSQKKHPFILPLKLPEQRADSDWEKVK